MAGLQLDKVVNYFWNVKIKQSQLITVKIPNLGPTRREEQQ